MTTEPHAPAEVSVVIAMHNAAPFIAFTLDSIARQTLDCVREIIVVDDASTDDSGEIVTRYGDSRIRLVRLDRNRGVSAAREVGVQAARYAWVAFNDADDVWFDDKLERQFVQLRRHRDAIGCVGGNGRLDRDSRRQWQFAVGPWQWRPEENPHPSSPPYFRPVLDGHVYIQSLVVLREIAMAERFNPALRLMEDQDYLLRLVRHGQFVTTERPVFLYRLGFSNTTAHGRMRANEFLAHRDYLYRAISAADAGLAAPVVTAFLEDHVAKADDIEVFEISQRFRHFNTIWVDRGFAAALINLAFMFFRHPLQSSRFIVRRIRHWTDV